MLKPATVDRVIALLAAGRSHRAAAREGKVSRTSVGRIASGQWATSYTRYLDRRARRDDGRQDRCKTCGGMVDMPCRACRIRRLQRTGLLKIVADGGEGPLRVELHGVARERYKEMHAQKGFQAAICAQIESSEEVGLDPAEFDEPDPSDVLALIADSDLLDAFELEDL